MKHNTYCDNRHYNQRPCKECGQYLHLVNRQRYLMFPTIPTHLDRRNRVDNWYFETLEYLGIWPMYPYHDHQTTCHETHDRDTYHHRRQHHTTHKTNNHYLFTCINNKCNIDTFVVHERYLDLVAINPVNFEEKLYTTKCKCGMTCASKQIVNLEDCEFENCHKPIYPPEPRHRRKSQRVRSSYIDRELNN